MPSTPPVVGTTTVVGGIVGPDGIDDVLPVGSVVVVVDVLPVGNVVVDVDVLVDVEVELAAPTRMMIERWVACAPVWSAAVSTTT